MSTVNKVKSISDKTLKEIVMQKTEQWHHNNPVHIIETGFLISKPQTNNFDKSPVYQMFMDSLSEWLMQKRQESHIPNSKLDFYTIETLLEEVPK
jgi:hypothetical protein